MTDRPITRLATLARRPHLLARRDSELARARRGSLTALPVPADAGPAPEAGSSIVDSAIYVQGRRVTTPPSLADTFRALRAEDDAMAWIGLYRPSEKDLTRLAVEFDLHELAVEDAIVAHQRPKLERYGDTLFVVLRAARYVDATEQVEFGELHVFVGPDFVVTVRHAESPNLTAVRRRT